MKRALWMGVLFWALPSLAATTLHYAKPTAMKPGPPLSVSALARVGGRPHGEVAIETSSSIFIFPVVGSVQGANNTYYRSETTLINNRAISQTVEMFFFA